MGNNFLTGTLVKITILLHVHSDFQWDHRENQIPCRTREPQGRPCLHKRAFPLFPSRASFWYSFTYYYYFFWNQLLKVTIMTESIPSLWNISHVCSLSQAGLIFFKNSRDKHVDRSVFWVSSISILTQHSFSSVIEHLELRARLTEVNLKREHWVKIS